MSNEHFTYIVDGLNSLGKYLSMKLIKNITNN
jgi:hypothetical protein